MVVISTQKTAVLRLILKSIKCSYLIPDIREFFLSKEGQAEFAAWKAEQEKNKCKDKGEG